MPSSAQIAVAIDRRLAEARQEIDALEDARAALSAPATQTRRTPRRGTRARNRSATPPPAPSTSARVSAKPTRTPATANAPASTKPVGDTGAPKRSAPAHTPAVSARRRARELEPGQIEAVLRAAPQGRSLAALAKETGVADAKVRARLRELQSAGEVRSEGARRTSVWRLVSDEERIAARAAGIERSTPAAAGK